MALQEILIENGVINKEDIVNQEFKLFDQVNIGKK